jgi:hypothetical protein
MAISLPLTRYRYQDTLVAQQHEERRKELGNNSKGPRCVNILSLDYPLRKQGERTFDPMSEYTHVSFDLKTLIGQQVHSDYIHQQQERELVEASAADPDPLLVCYFCNREIEQDQPINLHHPIYKSNGGTHVEPAHERCHVEYHSRKGDYREFGRRSALTRAWAFNLKGVRDHPAYEFDRSYYLMLYAR